MTFSHSFSDGPELFSTMDMPLYIYIYMTHSRWARADFTMDLSGHPGGRKNSPPVNPRDQKYKTKLICLKRLVVSPHVVYSQIFLPTWFWISPELFGFGLCFLF